MESYYCINSTRLPPLTFTSKLLNRAKPGTIKNMKKLNKQKKKKINLFQGRQNIEEGIAIAQKEPFNLELIGYAPETFLNRNKDAILGITWQLLKLDLF